MLTAVLAALYGLHLLVAALNALGMRRADPARRADWNPAVLIPARNEAENLDTLIPALKAQVQKVYVFDDESTDGTAEVAARHGAIVIRATQPLPAGWTGKNRACHELAKVAAEDHSGEHLLFLDADTHPDPAFIASLGSLVTSSRAPVVTGLPQALPGRGLEPAYLAWVAWLIGATNPFGLVRLTGTGHNYFLNGQIVVWRTSTYAELQPHESAKGEILEDVKIGRLLAKQGIRVETVLLSRVLQVSMYATLKEALDGMTKNSAFIAPPLVLVPLLLVFAWAWIAAPWTLALLLASHLLVVLGARMPLWVVPLLPFSLTAGALTVIRSWVWRRQGRLAWKGRIYPG